MTDAAKLEIYGVVFSGDDGGADAYCTICDKQLATSDGFGTQQITITLKQLQEHQEECCG